MQAHRSLTMSSLCRCFRTACGCPAANPLIRLLAIAVAEWRQGVSEPTPPLQGLTRLRVVSTAALRKPHELPGMQRFDNAYCRSFSTLHRPSSLSYTPPQTNYRWFVMVLTVSGRIRSQHNLPIGWWVNAHIRGRCYELEIATYQGCKCAAGADAGGCDFHGCRTRGV